MRPADTEKTRRYAKDVVKGLMWFALLKSTDPEKQELLGQLDGMRLQIQDIMDVVAPGWERE